jgi:hypothetical protein
MKNALFGIIQTLLLFTAAILIVICYFLITYFVYKDFNPFHLINTRG